MLFCTNRLLIFAAILTVTLTACSSADTPVAQQPIEAATTVLPAPTNEPKPTPLPTEAPPTEIPTETPPPAPTATEPIFESPVAQPEDVNAPTPASSIRTFQIVPNQSQATYAVEEEFFNRSIDFFTAVGTTNVIEGQFTLNLADGQINLSDNAFVVDLSTLTSDDNRRDNRIRDSWLESSRYPLAQFTATGLEDFPADAAEGQDVAFKLNGNMTIREITQPLTFETIARLDGDTFSGTATTQLLMKDFGFDPPSILGILEVTDGVTVTVNFVAQEMNP